MDEDKFQKFIATFSQQFIILAGQVSEIRASVNVLKVVAATQLSPDDPVAALKLLQRQEKVYLDSDPNNKDLQEASATIEAVNLWKKHGGGKHEA